MTLCISQGRIKGKGNLVVGMDNTAAVQEHALYVVAAKDRLAI
jgi:hypothetical protein